MLSYFIYIVHIDILMSVLKIPNNSHCYRVLSVNMIDFVWWLWLTSICAYGMILDLSSFTHQYLTPFPPQKKEKEHFYCFFMYN